MEFKKAEMSDLKDSLSLIDQAKEYLKNSGVDQWQKGYPNEDTIYNDILKGNAYILKYNDDTASYVCISFDGEESYKSIQGKWKSIQPYAVIHRLAVSSKYRGKGLAKEIFKEAEKLCHIKNIHSIKIDTDNDNTIMKQLLTKNGYSYCGVIRFDNSDKIAYEKLI